MDCFFFYRNYASIGFFTTYLAMENFISFSYGRRSFAFGERAFVVRMIVKSLMAHRVLYDCEDWPRAWANNATRIDLDVDFLFGRHGLLTSSAHPPQDARRVAQSCSPLITREYFLISVFSLAPSLRPSSATNAPYRQRSRKYHYSYARGLLLRARNFNKLKCLSQQDEICVGRAFCFIYFLIFSSFLF